MPGYPVHFIYLTKQEPLTDTRRVFVARTRHVTAHTPLREQKWMDTCIVMWHWSHLLLIERGLTCGFAMLQQTHLTLMDLRCSLRLILNP